MLFKFKLLSLVFFVLPLLLLSVFGLINPRAAKAQASSWQKSSNIPPKSSGDYGSDSFKQSVRNWAAIGGNQVTLILPYYQSNLYSTDINRGWDTPTDQSLIDAINYLHSQGLKVALKIHLESYTGEWRANINPGDRHAWFGAYGQVLNHYADIGKKYGVEQLILGAELYRMTSREVNNTNTQNWRNLISSVRSRYSGTLSYSAQHTHPYEENEIDFWDALDQIGLAAYFPLAENQNDPSIESLKSSWEYWQNQIIRPLQQRWGKPIIFTEIGYRSVDGAHKEPYAWWRGGGADLDEQSRDYEALLSYWSNQPNFAGLHLWEWESNPGAGGQNSDSYTPQNKPAELVIKKWFSSDQTTPPSSPTTPISSPNFNISGSYSAALVTANITSSQNLSDVLVDLEIFDSQGNKVYQQYFEHQNLNANGAKTYQITWSTPGNYNLKVGVFTAAWAQTLIWHDHVFDFTVGNAPSITTPTPTSTKAPNPSPTTVPFLTPTPTQAPPVSPTPPATSNIDVWWPTDNATVSGNIPFKGILFGRELSQYHLFWQVDQGGWIYMPDNQNDYPHKEVNVDVSGWNWRGNGPYQVNFIAQDLNGTLITQKQINIYISH
jgi:hypothetical protein